MCGSNLDSYRAVWLRLAWYSSGCTGVSPDFRHEHHLLNPYVWFVTNQQFIPTVYKLRSWKSVVKQQNIDIVIQLIQSTQLVATWAPCGRCVCVCVCMYAYVYLYYVYICIYMYVCVYIYVCTYVCVYICTCIYTYIYVCMYVCMCIYMYVYTSIYVYICMYICICVCMYMYIYVCVYIRIHIYIYVCIYVCMYVSVYVCKVQPSNCNSSPLYNRPISPLPFVPVDCGTNKFVSMPTTANQQALSWAVWMTPQHQPHFFKLLVHSILACALAFPVQSF